MPCLILYCYYSFTLYLQPKKTLIHPDPLAKFGLELPLLTSAIREALSLKLDFWTGQISIKMLRSDVLYSRLLTCDVIHFNWKYMWVNFSFPINYVTDILSGVFLMHFLLLLLLIYTTWILLKFVQIDIVHVDVKICLSHFCWDCMYMSVAVAILAASFRITKKMM